MEEPGDGRGCAEVGGQRWDGRMGWMRRGWLVGDATVQENMYNRLVK